MFALVSDKYYISQDSAKVPRLSTSQQQAIKFKTQQSAVNYYKDVSGKNVFKEYEWSILNLENNSIISIENYYKEKKLNIANIDEVPSYDLDEVIRSVAMLLDIKKNSDNKKLVISKKISELDKSISDIMHYIELGTIDESNAVNIINQLRNLRLSRRVLKNTQMSIEIANKMKVTEQEFGNMKQITECVYNARELDEVCLYSDNTISNTQEESEEDSNVKEAV